MPATLDAFLDRHPPRDAAWLGLYAQASRQATLLLYWDAAILAVRFDELDRMEVKLRDGRLTSAVSGPTNRAADVYRTHVVDRHGGDATLVHSPGVRLLLLGAGREVLPLLLPAETL